MTLIFAGTGWGASVSTLRTATLALVYAPAEYCAPVWSRSAHAHLVDASLNNSLRTISGCLRPTPVEQLPVLAGIPPADLRRKSQTLVLTRRALNPGHLLHEVVNRDVQQPRLKSRHPFTSEAHTLIHQAQTKETSAHWTGNE